MRTMAAFVFFAATIGAAAVARADAPPLPPGAHLRGTVEGDAIRETPELKAARINRARDESVTGVRTLDQTWDADVGYDAAVRFYDRALADALVLEREQADTSAGWLVKFDDGTVASVVVRNTHPTTIEIQRVVP